MIIKGVIEKRVLITTESGLVTFVLEMPRLLIL